MRNPGSDFNIYMIFENHRKHFESRFNPLNSDLLNHRP